MRYEEVKVSIVIVNYNVKYFLEQCLQSVRMATRGIDTEVVVVDNHSTDGSVAYLRPRFPEVFFIENQKNLGFSAANNQGILQCRGEYVLLLNPDTVIGEETVRTLCYFMDEHPQAGGAGVKMLDGRGLFLPESKRSFPTPWVSFCKIFGLSKLFPGTKLFARYSLPYLNPDRQHRVDVLAGAFMMIRHEALDKVGRMDESFFMYGEDIDLSYRLVLNGYTNHYVPERILHYKGESTRRHDAAFVRNFYGAMLIFYKKHYPRSGRLMSFLIRMAIGLKAFLTSVMAASARRAEEKRRKKVKKRRALILCRDETFAYAGMECRRRMPEVGYLNRWDLDKERATDAIRRRHQMKVYTDIIFCFPDMRFEQMLLLMDSIPNKKTMYHIYNKMSDRMVSPTKQ
ncbi:MAG: glycosyltransferase family 2 protein [Tannerellaceae bacterium]|jgi:GT2 family glycosyltransferase|nr:glycosyltransferase family 2 protein [Tannerellaceae bacterium]